MKLKNTFHPFAATTILLWSLAFPLTKLALQSFTPFSLGFLRYAAASAVLLVLCLIKKLPLPKKKDLPWFLLAGAMGFFLYMIAFNIGIATITSATSSVILAGVPVFTALLAVLFFREKLRGPQWLAIGVEFGGILILTMAQGAFTANAGALWTLLAAFLVCGYNLLQRRLTRTYSALQTTAYSMFAGTLLLAVFAPQAVAEAAQAPPSALLWVSIMGVLPSAIAYIAWARAFALAPRTSYVTNYMFFTPFLAGLLGFLFAREVPDLWTWIGGSIILLGALIFNRAGHRRESVDS
ncbi:MAG: DMT family transporter [Clostridiales bacterium]|nr:DMT family transporter [Clostridiales bacterium]